MKLETYKNHDFGTYTLLEDKLAWVDNEGAAGMLGFTGVRSVWLGEESTGSTPGMGNASLTGVMDGTVLKTIPGKPPTNLEGGAGLWAMKIRGDDQLVTLRYNPTSQDDGVTFARFVRAVHENIAKSSPTASYVGGGVLNLLVFVFLSIVLLTLGGGTAFFGKATGLSILILLGGILTLIALALLIWGVRTTKPKAYDPHNIPDKLLPYQ